MPMTKEESRALWDKVQANQRAIEACTGHAFEDLTPEKTIGKRFRCSVCKGEFAGTDKYWYDQGRAHGVTAAAKGTAR